MKWSKVGNWIKENAGPGAALIYALYSESPDVMILGALLTLPWAYAGLRQVGKGIDSFTSKKAKS